MSKKGNRNRAVPATYAKMNFGKIMRIARSGRRNFIITTHGKPTVVITSIQTFLNNQNSKKLRAPASQVIITGVDTQ